MKAATGTQRNAVVVGPSAGMLKAESRKVNQQAQELGKK